MLFTIDGSAKAPIYEQLVAQVRRAISEGELAEGDRLPPARELAASLDINMHTVLRAYGLLREEGIVDMRRGRGVTVARGATNHNRLRELAGLLAAEARKQNATEDEIFALLREYL